MLFDAMHLGKTCTMPLCITMHHYATVSTGLCRREGTGLLGSTEEECCDKLFCSDFKGLCSAVAKQAVLLSFV
jgi:hypothetical protein